MEGRIEGIALVFWTAERPAESQKLAGKPSHWTASEYFSASVP
jgi:hypothetical protein